MQKIYALIFFLLPCLAATAQFQVNGAASQISTNEFAITPATENTAGSVFSTTQIDLTKNFELKVKLYFGNNNLSADGIGFVLQNEGAGYLGNSGAGLGYHRFDDQNPVPSFIVEFDTYMNIAPEWLNLGDPEQDHLGFVSRSNAYHNNASTALSQPYPFAVDIEDGQWHDVQFSWNAGTKVFKVSFLSQTYTYSGDIVTDLLQGNPLVYWGFTGSNGHWPNNEHKLLFESLEQLPVQPPVPPLAVSGVVTHASCGTGGAINLTVSGGDGTYNFVWSNGSVSEDVSGLAAGNYTVTVTDAGGRSAQSGFTVANGPDVVAPQVNCVGAITFCQNLFSYYNIPDLTATDNCSIPANGVTYTITGATNRSGSGRNADGFYNAGTSTITWKVKDAAGNQSTCTTRVVINKLSITIPDVYAVNPGGRANTIYKGYGPSALTLTANVTGGTAPYTYLWSNGATTKSIQANPSQPGIHTYIVTVKDAQGCLSLMIKFVIVEDIRCGNNKVQLCHIPNGNTRKADEVCVSTNAVAAHLAHGDKLGACRDDNDQNDQRRSEELTTESFETAPAAGLYPNPSTGKFQFTTNEGISGNAQLLIINSNGLVVERKTVVLSGKTQAIALDLTGKPAGMYLVKLIAGESTQTEKVLIQR